MREFAVAIVALCLIEADAECLVPMLELKVAHCLGECCDLTVVFQAGLHLATSFLAVAFAGLAFGAFALSLHGGACAWLKECVHVCSYARHFVQGFVKCPPFCMQAGDFVPNFSVCLQEFLRVYGAEAGVGRQLLRAKIQNLFVKCFESGQVRAIA